MERRSLKKIRASAGFEPVTSANTGAMLYQLSYEATHWEHSFQLLKLEIYCNGSLISSTPAVQNMNYVIYTTHPVIIIITIIFQEAGISFLIKSILKSLVILAM